MAPMLLIDGDRNFRRVLEVALRLDGAQVTAAESVDEALVRLGRDRFDVAVVDYRLPGADALLEQLSASGIRAIATGTYPELLCAAISRHPGITTLEKPFWAAELRAHLASEWAAFG